MAQRDHQQRQNRKPRVGERWLSSRARQARPYLARRLSPALFIVALALALAALYQAKQTVTSHRETTERLIRDYGAFVAWSFRQHAAEALREHFRTMIAPAVHEAPDGSPPGSLLAAVWRSSVLAALASEPSDTVATCAGCVPSFFFRIPLTRTGDADVAEPISRATAERVAAAIREHARGPGRPKGDFTTVRAPEGVGAPLLVYAVVGADSINRIAYGFDFDPGRYAPLFERIFTSEQLLPAVVTGTRRNRELIAVDVRTPLGESVLVTPAGAGQTAPASIETLGAQLGDLEVRAAILRSAASTLGGAALPSGRLPLIAGLLALACGFVVIAINQMRRDAELARMRSDFVSSVSHELRTPLAQVQLFLETLRYGRHKTDAQREWIFENMQRETTRLTSLVDNVLHFSRAERGVLGGAREPTELDEYLHSIVATFTPLASIRGVTLEADFEPGLVAQLHRESFRQVMLNLLDNAVKYGPKGQTVRLSTGVAGDRLRICVEDEGPGVETSERDAIFEPFRRGEKAVGSVVVGSGIGLSVVRELVEWHDGRIWVENAAGGGARFVIDLAGWRGLSAPTPTTAAVDSPR